MKIEVRLQDEKRLHLNVKPNLFNVSDFEDNCTFLKN